MLPIAMTSGEGSLSLARKSPPKGGRHGVSVGLFDHVGIVFEELLKGAHDLTAFQTGRRAIDLLPAKRR